MGYFVVVFRDFWVFFCSGFEVLEISEGFGCFGRVGVGDSLRYSRRGRWVD